MIKFSVRRIGVHLWGLDLSTIASSRVEVSEGNGHVGFTGDLSFDGPVANGPVANGRVGPKRPANKIIIAQNKIIEND